METRVKLAENEKATQMKYLRAFVIVAIDGMGDIPVGLVYVVETLYFSTS
jgi:hypothetical protein